jgi:hypothetical protein
MNIKVLQNFSKLSNCLTLEQKIPDFAPLKPGYCYRKVTSCVKRLSVFKQAAKFGIISYEPYEFSTGWSFIIYTGQGMELTNNFMNSDTNKVQGS